MMMKTLTIVTAAAAIIASTGHAQLLPATTDEPVDITGDTAEFADNLAIWTGNVRVLQGEAILTAERLEAELTDEGDFETIRAIGDVRYSNGKEAITGARAVYDNERRTITIMDDVILTQGKQVLAAGQVVYWVDTGKVRFIPAEGERIRGIFYSKGAGEQS